MKKRRKIIVYIAISADGYIARPDGDVAWLDRPRPKANYGYSEFFKKIDTILWGRKTYAKGIEMRMKGGGFGPGIKNYLFSRQPQGSLETGFEWINEPIKTFAQRLRVQSGKDIWMMGGGEIIASFLKRRRNRRVQHPCDSHFHWRGDPASPAPAPVHPAEPAIQQDVSRRRSAPELQREGSLIVAAGTV